MINVREKEVSCDGCTAYLICEDSYSFKDIVAELKREGWTHQYNDEWINLCPDCSEKGR